MQQTSESTVCIYIHETMYVYKYIYECIGEETLQPLDESFSPGGRTNQSIDSFRVDVKRCHDQQSTLISNLHCGGLASRDKCFMFGLCVWLRICITNALVAKSRTDTMQLTLATNCTDSSSSVLTSWVLQKGVKSSTFWLGLFPPPAEAAIIMSDSLVT